MSNGGMRMEAGNLGPGDVLARKYRLVSILGQGGTAAVWVAENIALNTHVAVKILHPMLASDPRLVARFRQEARATASLSHKNIVHVFDFGLTNQGAPFIVMELLRGQTLAHRLKERGRLPLGEAIPLLLRAMKGVTVAHAKGIVHRDLKPENIFLALEENGTERPKVLDFGVSFVAGESGSVGGQHFTRTGVLVGTPAYLPPEVIQAVRRADIRADVWAFGVLLYEMVTGQSPFAGTTIHALMHAIIHEPPRPLHDVAPELDPSLEPILLRALAKNPEERFSSMRAFFDELNGWFSYQYPVIALAATGSARVSQAEPIHEFLVDEEAPTYVGGDHVIDEFLAAPVPPPPSPPTRSRMSAPLVASLPKVSTALNSAFSNHRWWQLLRTPAGLFTLGVAAAVVVLVPMALWLFRARVQHENFAEQILLDVQDVPVGARIIANGAIATLPLEVARGTKVRLVIESPGYLPWQQDIEAKGTIKLTFFGVRTQKLSAPAADPSAATMEK